MLSSPQLLPTIDLHLKALITADCQNLKTFSSILWVLGNLACTNLQTAELVANHTFTVKCCSEYFQRATKEWDADLVNHIFWVLKQLARVKSLTQEVVEEFCCVFRLAIARQTVDVMKCLERMVSTYQDKIPLFAPGSSITVLV